MSEPEADTEESLGELLSRFEWDERLDDEDAPDEP